MIEYIDLKYYDSNGNGIFMYYLFMNKNSFKIGKTIDNGNFFHFLIFSIILYSGGKQL